MKENKYGSIGSWDDEYDEDSIPTYLKYSNNGLKNEQQTESNIYEIIRHKDAYNQRNQVLIDEIIEDVLNSDEDVLLKGRSGTNVIIHNKSFNFLSDDIDVSQFKGKTYGFVSMYVLSEVMIYLRGLGFNQVY